MDGEMWCCVSEVDYMIYALIQDGYGNEFQYRCTDHEAIYNRIMNMSENDHEVASDIASWCEIATVGERYVFREGTVDICE